MQGDKSLEANERRFRGVRWVETCYVVDWSNFQGGTGNLREGEEGVLKNTGVKAG